MAARGAKLVTLPEEAKGKDKAIGKVAEVLVEHNPMLNDIPYMEMNEGTVHKESIRSNLPSVYYRKANQPIPASKTAIEERTFTASHFESKSQMDQAVADRGGRRAFNRWNQAQGHLQSMAQEHADLTIYGSPASAHRKSPGLADVYSSLASSEETSNQIIDAGGSGSDNASIYIIFWGPNSVFGVYPTGTQAGLKRTDHSKGGKLVQILGTDVDGNTGHFWGYEEQFEIDHGLVVKDYRQAVRIANIDLSDLKSGSGAADIIDLLISGLYKIDSLENGNGVIYMNRTLQAFLDKQALSNVSAGGGLSYGNYQGKEVMKFRNFPIRRSDALLNSESQVTA